MNLPNQITTLRVLCAFVMTGFLTAAWLPFGKSLALAVFVVAAISDYWDGRLARSRGCVTPFGQLMDPLADKILVSAAFICFAALDRLVPPWIVIVIISREFLVTGLRLLAANEGHLISAGAWGKHKTAWQLIVLIAVLVGLVVRDDLLPRLLSSEAAASVLPVYTAWFRRAAYALSAFAGAITVVSGAIYLYEHRDLLRRNI